MLFVHIVTTQAPLPPQDLKRRALTPQMVEKLEMIKAVAAKYPELPRGLTTVLSEFMASFASRDTLRRRLQSHDAKGDAGADAPAATLMAAPVTHQAPTLAPPRPLALEPVPTEEKIEQDMELLKMRVQARCAQLQSANAGTEADDFQSMFKWDHDCEEALYAVIINSQRMAQLPGTCVVTFGSVTAQSLSFFPHT